MTTAREQNEAEERSAPTGAVVYEAIYREGESELARSSSALAWSGIAAGLSMAFSFVTSAVLQARLPDQPWRPLLVALGYPVGFVIVILGRQQLFTENTLTVMLPLFRKRDGKTLVNVVRLWAVVLFSNVLGAFVMAAVLAKTDAVSNETFRGMRALAQLSLGTSFSITVLRGIFAGWLAALTVWLLPFAETARPWVIALITYVVGVAHFSHVIAGAVEAAFLVIVGDSSCSEFSIGFFVPALIGNVLGGVLLVAAINHAQVVSGKHA